LRWREILGKEKCVLEKREILIESEKVKYFATKIE
jgi:hypothetical protein